MFLTPTYDAYPINPEIYFEFSINETITLFFIPDVLQTSLELNDYSYEMLVKCTL